MVSTWKFALDTKNRLHPVLIFAAANEKGRWHPFEYSITLECFMGNETIQLTRFDNKSKEYKGHHFHIFFENGSELKHIPSPLPPITKLEETALIAEFIDGNLEDLVESYTSNMPVGNIARAVRAGGVRI